MVIIASVTVVTMIVAVVVMTAVLSVHVMRVIVMVIRRRHGGADCDRAVKRPQGHDESTPLHPQQSHSDQNDKRIAHDFDGIDRAPDGRRSRIQQRGGRCPPEPPRPGPETARRRTTAPRRAIIVSWRGFTTTHWYACADLLLGARTRVPF